MAPSRIATDAQELIIDLDYALGIFFDNVRAKLDRRA